MLHERDRVRGSEPWEPAKLVQAILSGLEGGGWIPGPDAAESAREDGLYGQACRGQGLRGTWAAGAAREAADWAMADLYELETRVRDIETKLERLAAELEYRAGQIIDRLELLIDHDRHGDLRELRNRERDELRRRMEVQREMDELRKKIR